MSRASSTTCRCKIRPHAAQAVAPWTGDSARRIFYALPGFTARSRVVAEAHDCKGNVALRSALFQLGSCDRTCAQSALAADPRSLQALGTKKGTTNAKDRGDYGGRSGRRPRCRH